MTNYIALIWKEDGTSFGVNFPDFPGFITAGDTLDAAMANAREGLAFHIEGMTEVGETVPAPSTIEAIRRDPHYDTAVVALVDVATAKPKAVRVNVTINEDALRWIDAGAARHGMSRSAFLVYAAAALLGDDKEGAAA